jgi:hypothetical protein
MHKAGPTGEQALGTHTALEAVKRCQDAQQCWLAERLLISQERSTREPVDLSQAARCLIPPLGPLAAHRLRSNHGSPTDASQE